MKISLLKYALILPLLLAAACAQDADSPQSPEPASAKFRISAAAADPGTPEDPVADNEKIKSYKIIFVNDQQTAEGSTARIVRAIVEKKFDTGAVEEDIFTVDLAPGTYDIYAIANISTNSESSTISDDNYRNIIDKEYTDLPVSSLFVSNIGDKAPSHEAILSAFWKDMPNGYIGDIPMCGFIKDAKVTGKIEETFSVEVVRMLAKMEFKFSAPDATVPVTIKKVTVHGVSTGAIPFMPDYSILGTKAPTLLGLGREDLVFAFDNPLQVNNDGMVSTGTKYLRESIAEVHPSKSFLISVDMLRGTDGEEGKEWQDVVQYAIANELQYINRNDHIVIPIRITDWILDIDVHFYPPIGGYPAVIVKKNKDEHYITFGTQGTFEIITSVRNAKPDSTPLSKDNYKVAIGTPEITNTTEGSPNLFVKNPYISKTGEILGEVSSATGIARVPISVSITYQEDGKDINATCSRNLFIIRK